MKKNKAFNTNKLKYIHKAKALLQKELNINQQEQILINKKMETIKEFSKHLDKKQPEYLEFHNQTLMEQINLDELKNKEEEIIDKIKKTERKQIS